MCAVAARVSWSANENVNENVSGRDAWKKPALARWFEFGHPLWRVCDAEC